MTMAVRVKRVSRKVAATQAHNNAAIMASEKTYVRRAGLSAGRHCSTASRSSQSQTATTANSVHSFKVSHGAPDLAGLEERIAEIEVEGGGSLAGLSQFLVSRDCVRELAFFVKLVGCIKGGGRYGGWGLRRIRGS